MIDFCDRRLPFKVVCLVGGFSSIIFSPVKVPRKEDCFVGFLTDYNVLLLAVEISV